MFLGTSISKVDSKGRVSVPARFRAVLERDGLDYIYCHAPLHIKEGALNAGGKTLISKVEETLAQLGPLSEEYETLAHAYFGTGEELPLDAQGRILMPERTRARLKLKDAALFTGLGHMFQIWHPQLYDPHIATMPQQAGKIQRNLDVGGRA